MTENEYLEMPWSIEDTIENLNEIKENFKVILINKNLDGKASDDVKELEFDFDRAINALEKQIPKKVKIEQWIYTKCDCGYEFSKHHGDGYYSIPLENKTKYCPNCGQKLNWEIEEE